MHFYRRSLHTFWCSAIHFSIFCITSRHVWVSCILSMNSIILSCSLRCPLRRRTPASEALRALVPSAASSGRLNKSYKAKLGTRDTQSLYNISLSDGKWAWSDMPGNDKQILIILRTEEAGTWAIELIVQRKRALHAVTGISCLEPSSSWCALVLQSMGNLLDGKVHCWSDA